MIDVKVQANGRWRDILPSLGIDRSYLTGKHTACPICREGKNRFRFTDWRGDGGWICGKGGCDDHGNGVDLVMKVNGWDFRTAAAEIRKHIGGAEYRASKPERSDADKLDAMNAVWKATRPIEPDDPAGRYLMARTGLSTFPECLRFAERLRYFDDVGSSYHPALVAMVVDAEGRPANIHRTYLSKLGAKAAVADPRRTMPGSLPHGSAIRLAPHAGVLGIAEGIETALSATALFDVPCWAVINAAIMSKWIVPPDVRELIIFGDNDPSYAGHSAAYELAHRVRVAKASFKVSVRLPPVAGTDWNDVHAQKSVAA